MMSFQEAAIQSARLYYDYLSREGKGVITYKVKTIRRDSNSGGNIFWLELDRVPVLDELLIKVDNQIYKDDEVRVLQLDRVHKMLKIRLRNDRANIFDGVVPDRIRVISDLRFLVKRVEYWYRQNGHKIKMPTSRKKQKPANFKKLNGIASSDQIEAIEGVLNNPFTYIWGAPGTGKTQFVLSH